MGDDSLINDEEKLKRYIREHNIAAEHLHSDNTLHTVEETVQVVGSVNLSPDGTVEVAIGRQMKSVFLI